MTNGTLVAFLEYQRFLEQQLQSLFYYVKTFQPRLGKTPCFSSVILLQNNDSQSINSSASGSESNTSPRIKSI